VKSLRVVVGGAWRPEVAAACQQEAQAIGRELAVRGHILVSGGGTGVSELVAKAYREAHGKKHVVYLPARHHVEAVGEKPGSCVDETIETDLDYPMRNAYMIRENDAFIAMNGRLGTLGELIHAINDYAKPAVVIDVGDMVQALRNPLFHEKVLITTDAKAAVAYIEHRLQHT
jgi:uncharacterized protein (TIGR00725 family)